MFLFLHYWTGEGGFLRHKTLLCNYHRENPAKGAKRLTDEDMIVGRVGKDDGVAEQTSGVVHGGGGNCRAGEGNALICGPHRRGRSMAQGTFRFREILDGRSCDKEGENSPSSGTDTGLHV